MITGKLRLTSHLFRNIGHWPKIQIHTYEQYIVVMDNQFIYIAYHIRLGYSKRQIFHIRNYICTLLLQIIQFLSLK